MHLKGYSYIYDKCMSRELLERRATIVNKSTLQKKVRMEETCLNPICDSMGFGFFNSLFLLLFGNSSFSQLFKTLIKKPSGSIFLQHISYIFELVSSGSSAAQNTIADWLALYFKDYLHF